MFDDVLAHVERSLDVPYPEREAVLRELRGELEAAYLAQRARGLPADAARAAALEELALDGAARASLAQVHASATRRALLRLAPDAREWVEWLLPTAAVAGAFVWVSSEVPVMHYIDEGGLATWVTLALGAMALLLQLHRGFVWFVVRDHSPVALHRHTSTPLYLAAATFLMGVLGCALGYYQVLHAWSEGRMDGAALRVGLREPIPCVVLGTSTAVLIVLLQGALAAGLRAYRIPEKPPHEGAKKE
jgi:hypothetical protein